MQDELVPLVKELCYIASKRNAINTRRHRARFRKNYYAGAIRVIEAHNGSNAELRYLERHNTNSKHQAKIDAIKSDMAWLVKKHPNPLKWKTMGIIKLRSLMLQGEGEYALAKHETMELSLKTTAKVKEVLSKVKGQIVYDNGSIRTVVIEGQRLTNAQVIAYADGHELSLAVIKMIEEYDEER